MQTIRLIPISKIGNREQVLYDLLKERPEIANISHKTLPSFEEHCRFVASKPYLYWWFVMNEPGKCVGSAYITKTFEIGIFIFADSQRMGYAKATIRTIMERFPHTRLKANIAPANLPSQQLFMKLGFTALQVTFIAPEATP